MAPSETQCNHQGDFHDYNIHRFCNVKNVNKIYENKDISLSLCGEYRPNFGCSPLPLSNPHIFVFNKTVTEMNYGLKKIEYYPNNSNHTCLVS